jgi:hypothetical protein
MVRAWIYKEQALMMHFNELTHKHHHERKFIMTTIIDTTTTALVATVVDGEIVFPVIMEDEPVHTAENGYRCDDRSCPCWRESREKLPLNGNHGFSLLK